MNPYAMIGLPNVINAAGKMTYLGSSAVLPQVAQTMFEASQTYVDMASLKTVIGRKIAELTGAEGACVTSCAAAGIVTSVAACLTGTDLDRIESLPDIKGPRHEVILQKGHAVHFGAKITQMIRMTGAQVREIGTVNGTKPYHLEGAIHEGTAAVLYVISHHAISNEMLRLPEVVEIAHRHGVPVIVDAAAEVDLQAYCKQGADLVVYSGHKAIGGPTSGIVLGKRELIEACQLQEKGYARAMKIGKENIMGLYAALRAYVETDAEEQKEGFLRLVERLEAACSGIPNITTRIAWDATRPIPRLQVKIDEGFKLSAKEVISRMESGSPSIRTRNHLADQGIIQFDPRELKREEIDVIATVLRRILT